MTGIQNMDWEDPQISGYAKGYATYPFMRSYLEQQRVSLRNYVFTKSLNSSTLE